MTRKISRGVRAKPPRKPALLPSLLRALDARPDVTVVTREWPVVFVQLRYALEKTVQNPDGFSPLHRETPLFFGQAWQVERVAGGHIDIEAMPLGETDVDRQQTIESGVWLPETYVALALGPIHPEVSARLGLSAAVERETAITGRSMER